MESKATRASLNSEVICSSKTESQQLMKLHGKDSIRIINFKKVNFYLFDQVFIKIFIISDPIWVNIGAAELIIALLSE